MIEDDCATPSIPPGGDNLSGPGPERILEFDKGGHASWQKWMRVACTRHAIKTIFKVLRVEFE